VSGQEGSRRVTGDLLLAERGRPARNIEVKARIADPASLRSRVASLAPLPCEVLVQRDTFFAVPRGRLKLRELSGGSGELIFYERADHAGPKESSFLRYACREPGVLSMVLDHAFGVRGVVEKRREVFMIGRTRVHLDEVRGLGSFLEIEVVLDDGEAAASGEHVARELLAVFGIRETALVGRAYIDLLEESKAG
jgi:predicted adenylyl cyclase CyaB